MTNPTYQIPLLQTDEPCIYSADTCVFLDMWQGNAGAYPKNVYVGLWQHVDSLVVAGRLIVHAEVYEELKVHAEQNTDFKAWLKLRKSDLVVNTKQSVLYSQKVISEYVSQFKGSYRPTKKNAADPFVVGLAMERNAVVFTQEKRLGSVDLAQANFPKVPNMCDEYKLECVDINGFLQREGVVLNKGSSLDRQAPVLQSKMPSVPSS